jgi:hypothetical protein
MIKPSKLIQQLATLVLVSIFLTLFGYSAYLAIRALKHFWVSVNSQIAIAIIAATATVCVSVISIAIAKAYESRALIKRELREKKIPVYVDLLEFMSRILMGSKIGNEPSEGEVLKFLFDFNQRFMIWGADDVVAAWSKLRRTIVHEAIVKANPQAVMFLYEQLIMAIRRDLGHKNKNLGRGDILALFLNDIDQFISPNR